MKKILLVLLIQFIFSSNISAQFNSVLSTGDWYKLTTSEDGIYKIEYSDLQNLGVSLVDLHTKSIKIYSNGKGMLPKLNSQFRYFDLAETSIKVNDLNNDGFFNSDDYILFYGHSANSWDFNSSTNLFEHEINLFSNDVAYFLTIDDQSEGKRINNKELLLNPTQIINTFNSFSFHEREYENLIKSGKEWFGERFASKENQSFVFNFPNLEFSSSVFVKTVVAARSFVPSKFTIKANSSIINEMNVNNVVSTYATEYAKIASNLAEFNSNSSDIEINIDFNSTDDGALAWLNYIEINSRSLLRMSSSYLSFRDVNSISEEIGTFEISDVNSSISVWDVSDHTLISELQLNVNGSIVSFNDSLSSMHEYIAFNSESYMTPNLIGPIANQNLHNLPSDIEYVIVSHPNFLASAERLAAFHKNSSNLNSVIVTPQQIYNEFSSGTQDVSAIRDFLRMLYERPNSELKYLLLLGDGSYDPQNRVLDNTNYIPTYQSVNSTHPIYSYVTDDFFGLLDYNEGLLGGTDALDIGVGRFPVRTLEEANILVDKVENYHSKDALGSWRNDIVFVADDGDSNDGNTHMWQADSLANYVSDKYRDINIQKIYLDNYYQQSTTGGPRSPSAQSVINSSIEKGAFLVNYTGHGSPLGWTKERILELDQINSWSNANRLPLFMTATCKFSYFDNPAQTSAGEYVLLNPNGGAIALLSTTRLVYSPPNYNLNSKFIRTLFSKENGSFLRLGDVFKKTKILSGTSTNNRNFILLGDPALTLAYPKYQIKTTNIDDTLKALKEVIINGQIENEGDLLLDYNGVIYATVFDKEIIKTTLGQESCSPMPYRNQDNILYKGSASVVNGKFSFSFIVPKDIAYNYGPGKISYYSESDATIPLDANGSIGVSDSGTVQFVIGGTSEDIVYDYDGAEMDVFMNDYNFIEGGITDRNPVLLVEITDASGVNTVGNGIGHDITAVIDGNTSSAYVLNDFYESEQDNFKRGTVRFPFYNLDPGEHVVKVKVWDVFNNSSESMISFFVVDEEKLIVDNFICHPNPFANSTDIYFEHNKANQILDYSLDIYSITGVLVRRIERADYKSYGYRVGPISWDGKDKYGVRLGAGIYLLSLGVTLENGDFSLKSSRVILLP
jgi:hypothetical protein